MTKITAALVKELRDKTGGGMMDCKVALSECNGDIESSIDWLRSKGLSSAEKKSSRVAAEGLVGVYTNNCEGALVEVNSETDFVARNTLFQDFVRNLATIVPTHGNDIETIKELTLPGAEKKIGDQLTDLIAKIGENMTIRRASTITIKKGILTSYIHNSLADNVGKIGVLVGLESEIEPNKLDLIGKQLAMHIAATKPKAIKREDLSSDDLERERKILEDQAKETGRPDSIIEKMIEGRMKKFYEEVCLLEQTFVIDGEQ